jgi:surfeit locus 1 family protein
MAKSQMDNNTGSFVPSGLKVRICAPDEAVDPISSETETSRGIGHGTVSLANVELPPYASKNTPPSLTPDDESTQQPETTKLPPQGPIFRPMPVLTIVTLICLAILWLLGSWQWDKFVMKSRAPAATIAIEPASVSSALEAPNPEYRPVVVEGLIDSRIIKISTAQDSVRGYRIFSPVVLEAGGVFVDRGFVPEDQVNRIVILSGQVNMQGVLRVGARANAYTPDNDPASDTWYWPDLPAMATHLGIASMGQRAGPGFYVSLSKVDPLGTGDRAVNPYADSKGANQIPPERHLGYALTWLGFGLALIGVYMGLHVRNGRLRLVRVPSV